MYNIAWHQDMGNPISTCMYKPYICTVHTYVCIYNCCYYYTHFRVTMEEDKMKSIQEIKHLAGLFQNILDNSKVGDRRHAEIKN